MTLAAKAFNDMVSLPTVVTILNRHKLAQDVNRCQCCLQVWPCDVRILEGILIREVDE